MLPTDRHYSPTDRLLDKYEMREVLTFISRTCASNESAIYALWITLSGDKQRMLAESTWTVPSRPIWAWSAVNSVPAQRRLCGPESELVRLPLVMGVSTQ